MEFYMQCVLQPQLKQKISFSTLWWNAKSSFRHTQWDLEIWTMDQHFLSQTTLCISLISKWFTILSGLLLSDKKTQFSWVFLWIPLDGEGGYYTYRRYRSLCVLLAGLPEATCYSCEKQETGSSLDFPLMKAEATHPPPTASSPFFRLAVLEGHLFTRATWSEGDQWIAEEVKIGEFHSTNEVPSVSGKAFWGLGGTKIK